MTETTELLEAREKLALAQQRLAIANKAAAEARTVELLATWRVYDLEPETAGPLTALMPNTIAWRLGEVCMDAASLEQKVGDPIDRGLILLRLLNERGFDVVEKRA